MFTKSLIEAQLKLEQELRHQLLDKDEQIAELKEQLSLCQGKIERMELILMPLASPAGARYVSSLTPSTPAHAPKFLPGDAPVSSWQLYLQEHMAKMEEEDKLQSKLAQERKQERGN